MFIFSSIINQYYLSCLLNSREYQQRIPHELLSSLANCLLDDTIFQIVNGLRDIQQLTEKNLFQKRMKTLEGLKSKVSIKSIC